MKITPLDIKQKTFEKSFRGYDKDEVNAFLLSLSAEWEKMLEEYKELMRKNEVADREVQKLREVESSLYKTLKTAENTGASMIEQANKSAELHIQEAQMKADVLLNDAKDKIKDLSQDYRMIENYRDDLLMELKNLVKDTLEKVNKITANAKQSSKEVKAIFLNNEKKLKPRPEKEEIQPALTKSGQGDDNKTPKEEINERDTAKIEQEKSPSDQTSFFDQVGE